MNADIQTLLQRIDEGDDPSHDVLETGDRSAIIETLLGDPAGRRWLRRWPGLTSEVADRLLDFHDDFTTQRRDSSLEGVVRRASIGALIEQVEPVASGPAAGQLWHRLIEDREHAIELASRLAAAGGRTAAESTVYLLVLDPLDPYGIGTENRIRVARAGLSSLHTPVRSLAAEYLFDQGPDQIADVWEMLVTDEDERIRGLGWSAGIRTDTATALATARWMLADEYEVLAIRRSALAAIGTHFETRDVVDILADFVGHPERDLALDAGNLLYRLHRHPVIATAAAKSPHPEVREIGAFLLDPFRGSPAAGGSRPGDPTGSDIFAEMIRQTEERMLDDDDDRGPR